MKRVDQRLAASDQNHTMKNERFKRTCINERRLGLGVLILPALLFWFLSQNLDFRPGPIHDMDAPTLTSVTIPQEESKIPRRLIFMYVKPDINCQDCIEMKDIMERHPKSPRGLQKMVSGTIEKYKSFWANDTSVEVDFLNTEECLQAIEAVEPALLEVYKRENNGAFKSDICRVCYLYIHGGYYFDNDQETLEPYIPPPFVTFASVTANDEVNIAQSFVAVTPEHPIIKRSIQYLLDHYNGTHIRHHKKYSLVGPSTMRDAISEEVKHNPVMGDQIKLLHEMGLDQTRQGHHPDMYPEVPRDWGRPMCSFVMHSHEHNKAFFRSRGKGTPKC
jgi:hypothetical protein